MDDLTLALELADVADAITLGRFRSGAVRVETKPDMSPVSDVDRAVETAIRAQLRELRPGDAVVGEELGEDVALPGAGSAARRWIVDPIDGTRAYVRGLPVFASLIALEVGGSVELGVVSAPALRQRWWAARGQGAHRGDGPIHVSSVASLDDAFISTTDPRFLTDPGLRHAYTALARRCWTARMLGDFWSHVLVAEGTIDIAVEAGAHLWDWAPLLVIVEEAGGRFTDLDGSVRADGGMAVATNGRLHDEVLAALRV